MAARHTVRSIDFAPFYFLASFPEFENRDALFQVGVRENARGQEREQIQNPTE
jgi:hypothetical protein